MIKIVTLNAEYHEGWTEGEGQTGEIILRFGGAEICRWKDETTYFHNTDEQDHHVQDFVADKLRRLFTGPDGITPI